MALGLLLQIFLLSVLLFSSCFGAPLKQKLQKRPDASVNLSDNDDEDDDIDDDNDAAVNSLKKVVVGEVPFQPLQVPGFLTNQNVPVKQTVPWVKEPLTAQSAEKREDAFVFPLNPAVKLSNPATPSSPSPHLNTVSTNIQVPPFAYYPDRDFYYGWSWPEFDSFFGDFSLFNEGTPQFVYEQVFNYPNMPAGSPIYSSPSLLPTNYVQVGKGSTTGNPAAQDPQIISSQVPGSPYPLKIYQGGNLNLGQNGYIPLGKQITWPRQGPVINNQGAVVVQRLGRPSFPVPSSFVKSRSSYRKHRAFTSRTSYTPLEIFQGVTNPMLS